MVNFYLNKIRLCDDKVVSYRILLFTIVIIIKLVFFFNSCRALGRFSGSESSTDDDYGTASRKDCKCKNPAQVTGI